MEGGREQNYWPAFVDALSNVVLTLVFVLVIFVFALVMASSKVEKKMQEVSQAQEKQKAEASEVSAVQQASAQEVTELRQQLAAAHSEIDQLRQELKDASTKSNTGALNESAVSTQNADKQIAIDSKTAPTPKQGAVQIQNTANGITLSYPLAITEMDDKSASELGHIITALEKNMGKHKIILRSIIGKESYSAARRLAYYRAIGARNVLITKGGENPSNISSIIVQPPQPEDGRVEVIFQKQ